MFDSVFFVTGIEPVTRDLSKDIALGINVTVVGMSSVFIGLIFLVISLNIYQWIMALYTKLMFRKPALDLGVIDAQATGILKNISPAFHLETGRQPSTEEVAAIAASLYIQKIEVEAEHRYIRSYKRSKQGLHAWKEAGKFQLFNKTRR